MEEQSRDLIPESSSSCERGAKRLRPSLAVNLALVKSISQAKKERPRVPGWDSFHTEVSPFKRSKYKQTGKLQKAGLIQQETL